MATSLSAVRALLGEASRAVDEQSSDAEALVNMVKLFASEEVFKVCQHAVELHGGNGIMLDFGVEKHLREAHEKEAAGCETVVAGLKEDIAAVEAKLAAPEYTVEIAVIAAMPAEYLQRCEEQRLLYTMACLTAEQLEPA